MTNERVEINEDQQELTSEDIVSDKEYSSNKLFYEYIDDRRDNRFKQLALEGSHRKTLSNNDALSIIERYYAFIYDKEERVIWLYDYDRKIYTQDYNVIRKAIRILTEDVPTHNTVKAFVDNLADSDYVHNTKAVRETLLYELLNDEEVLAFDHLIGNDTEI